MFHAIDRALASTGRHYKCIGMVLAADVRFIQKHLRSTGRSTRFYSNPNRNAIADREPDLDEMYEFGFL